MPIFSFLEGVILTIPGVGWGGVGGVLRNKTKFQPNLVEVELWVSLVKSPTNTFFDFHPH